jgi:3-hydroxybutyryl-CoA dehydrogenase
MLQKGQAAIEKNLDQLVQKQKLTAEEAADCRQRLRYSSRVADCVADVVIEAVVERLDIKQQVLTELASYNAPHCILASNTSSLSITTLQQALPQPERVAGLHFFNPATVMKLVEVVLGRQTDPAVTAALAALARRMGKVPVHCKDAPGFIVNHIARPYYLESMRLVETGVASMETVDELLEATGFKMGPFKLMDLIGLDVNYSVSQLVWEAYGRPDRLQPSALQAERVAAGQLGRKTGAGFYRYND